MASLRPILADQLSLKLPSLQDIDISKDMIVLCEVRSETDYAPHHRQKIWFLFTAMRQFFKVLQQLNYKVHYVYLDDPANTQNLLSEWKRLAELYHCDKIVVTEPGEWRLKQQIQEAQLPINCLEDTRFLCTHAEFANWAKGKKQLRMEYFYQMMRKKYAILLNKANEPVGGKWNYDIENREPLKNIPSIPARPTHTLDDTALRVKELIERIFPNHFGDMVTLYYATTKEQALEDIHYFFSNCLPFFGQYQDNMLANEPYLFHGVLSMYLNIGFIEPLELCKEVEGLYKEGTVPLPAAEGFIRQVLGWREYIRGMYWLQMPDYKELNFFAAHRPLPDFYWGKPTKMNCIANVVSQTKQYAYSHHIQRLMITGNFALLAELNPKEVCDWYLGVYIDAYEWVELPNTLGMALFADGGMVASKPYAASSRYINAMSDFCKTCHYKTKLMLEDKACPFNSLYWNFVVKNETKLSANLRMKYIYATWNRFNPEKKAQILAKAKYYLELLDLNNI